MISLVITKNVHTKFLFQEGGFISYSTDFSCAVSKCHSYEKKKPAKKSSSRMRFTHNKTPKIIEKNNNFIYIVIVHIF